MNCFHNLCSVSDMSDYAQTLSVQDRDSYLRKLTLADGSKLADPYTLQEWQEDLTGLPKVEWPDIYMYLIETPCVYSKEKLKAYKSLDAYNYVINGHVQTVQYINLRPDLCVLRSEVLPSQRQGKKTQMYDTWVIVNRENNTILTANCTCMAG